MKIVECAHPSRYFSVSVCQDSYFFYSGCQQR